MPDCPEVPLVPFIPEVPEVPDTPEVPEVPLPPAPVVPTIPKLLIVRTDTEGVAKAAKVKLSEKYVSPAIFTSFSPITI